MIRVKMKHTGSTNLILARNSPTDVHRYFELMFTKYADDSKIYALISV